MAITRTFERSLVGGLLAAFFLLAWSSSFFQGQTVPEGANLSNGYVHLTGAEFGVEPQHPPLAKMIAAAPLVFLRPFLPHGSDSLSSDFNGTLGLISSQPQGRLLLAAGRLAMLLLNLLTAVALYRFTAEIFGFVGGIMALALMTFSPTFLAHSPLVTSDVALVLFMVLTLYGLLRINRGHDRSGFVLLSFGIGGGIASNLHYLFIAPVLVLAALTVVLLPLWEQLREVALRRLGLILAGLLGGYLLIWLIYLVPQVWGHQTDEVVGGLLPAPLMEGISTVLSATETSDPSDVKAFPAVRSRLPFVLLVKTTIALMVLSIIALLGSFFILRRFTDSFAFAFLPLVYLLLAYPLAPGHEGSRNFLPVMAMAFVLVGGLASMPIRRPEMHRALALLVSLHAIEAMITFPHFIPFFNAFTLMFGGPLNTLSDSNLDWGQGLPSLARWQAARKDEPLMLSYYGTDNPARYGLNFKPIASHSQGEGSTSFQPLRVPMSGLFAISATNLQGTHLERDLGFNPFAPFRRLKTVARPARSIYVYSPATPDQTILQAAIEYYARQAADSPIPSRASLQWASALIEDGRHADALPILGAYIRARPNDWLALERLGVARLSLGRPGDALEPLSQAVALNPANPRILYSVGKAHYELGQYLEARKFYWRADAAAPGFMDAAEMVVRCMELDRKRVEIPATTAPSQPTTSPTQPARL